MGQCSYESVFSTLQWLICLEWTAIPDPLVRSWVCLHGVCLQTFLLPWSSALGVGVLLPTPVHISGTNCPQQVQPWGWCSRGTEVADTPGHT